MLMWFLFFIIYYSIVFFRVWNRFAIY